MFWEKKKNESGLPDLPDIKPSFAHDLKEEVFEDEKNSLPSFPDSPSHNDFSQAAIKDAISTSEVEDSVLDEVPEVYHTESIPSIKQKHHSNEISLGKLEFPEPPQKSGEKDIYIKLEKYHSVKHALSDTKTKLEEIDSLLNRIREVKMREEQELSAWEKEILNSKQRLDEITKNLFEKA